MKITLNMEEKDLILNSLTPEQKEFIQHHVKRGKKNCFCKCTGTKIRGL